MKKRFNAILLIGLMMTLLFITACGDQEKEVEAKVLKENETQQKDTIEAFGIVKAMNTKNVTLDFSASLDKVHVTNGQKIKQRDPLVTLNLNGMTYDLQATKEQLQYIDDHLLKISYSTEDLGRIIPKLNNNIYTYTEEDIINIVETIHIKSSPEIKKTLNHLVGLRSTYDQEKKEVEKNKRLFNTGALSQYDYDQSKKVMKQKDRDIQNIIMTLEEIKYSFDQEYFSQKAKANELRNTILKLEDKLKNPSFLKDNTIIAEVEDGIVYDIGYTNGDIIHPGVKILSIIDLKSRVIEGEIPEAYIKDVKVGSRVTIIPLADTSIEYHGKVLRILGMAEKRNGETIVPVEISIEDEDGFLLPNFNVDLEIQK